MSLIEVKNVTKIYNPGPNAVLANDQLNFEINEGELAVVLGPSGAGKSTLLNLLGGMDSPTEGEIWIDGVDIATFSDKKLTEFRRRDVGFVFQFYNLVANLSTKENVELATQVSPNALDVMDVLKQVGLGDRVKNLPAQLSGGEQQRVAIARAIAKNPKLLLCDEPTGALDYETGKQVLKLLQNTTRELKKTVVIITHNSALAAMADRVIYLSDAKIKKIVTNDQPESIDDIEW